MTVMTEMTVSELARRADTTADTIRYYERVGLLPRAERSPAGYDRSRRTVSNASPGHARQALSDELDEIHDQLEALAQLRDDIQRLLDDGVRSDDNGCWRCGSHLIQIEPRPRRTT